MAIFRGTGGAGDATTDAYASEVAQNAATATTKAAEAASSASSAANSATSAANSAASATSSSTSAGASATTATNEATSASNSATSASSSASSATTKATEAATSAANALTSKQEAYNSQQAAASSSTQAENSKLAAQSAETNANSSANSASASATAAAASELNAGNSETNALASEGAASTSASAASTSAGQSATSASAAATSETHAATSETNAAASATTATTAAVDSQSARDDAEVAETNALNSEVAAQGSADTATTKATEASTSATAASGSAFTATTSATSAATSEANAATSAGLSGTSAANAATSEANASGSETAAATSATNASNSATAASGSATSASTSAGEAATSASSAAGSAGNAGTSETNASNSASAALTSANNASTSEGNAATSETNAGNSATAASNSESAAATSETNAATSATQSAGSATNASTSATNAATSETNAGTSATASANSATASSTSASEAAGSATSAANSAVSSANSATASANSATSASTSATSAANSLDEFEDIYLGTKAANPTLDNDGDALAQGALYFNSVSSEMRVYTGSSWVTAYVSLGDALLGSSNLSDVDSAETSRDNLSLGTTDAVEFLSVALSGSDSDEGVISWDSTAKTANLTMGNGVNQQIGEELYYPKLTRNMTGTTIPNGTPVMLVGGVGADSYIAPAISDGSHPYEFYAGLTTEDIPDGDYGRVLFFGTANDLDTSAYTKGQLLYVSDTTAGAFTTTSPQAPSHSILAALVTKVGTTDGRLFVRVHTNPEAGEITFDNTDTDLVSSSVQGAIEELDTNKANIDLLSSNITLFPTTATSPDVTGHNHLVTSKADSDYDTTAVDVATGTIGTSETLVGQLASDDDIIEGSIAGITITLIGNIEKLTGNANKGSHFYFRIYRRESDGTEHLMGESFHTEAIYETDGYEQFSSSVYLEDSGLSTFTLTDRIVLRFYGISDNTSTSYQFQFGGSAPIRAIVPVPVSVIPKSSAAQTPTVTTNFGGILSGSNSNVQSALDTLDDHGHAIADITGLTSTLNNKVNTTGYNKANWDNAYGWGNHTSAGYLTTLAFSGLTGKPTTISGYGITDAFDGAYGSLSGVPTNVSSFTNDSGYLTSHQNINGKANLSGATFTGNVTIEDSVLEVGDKSADNYVEIRQVYANDFGFVFQHSNASAFRNLQGTTNQVLVLGDVDTSSTDTLLGVSILQSSTYTKRLNLLGNGTMYIGSGTDRVFADNYHPNADTWTTARTLSLTGDASGSVSWNGGSNVSLSVTVNNDSHTHDSRYYTKTESEARYVNVVGDTLTGRLVFDQETITANTASTTINFAAANDFIINMSTNTTFNFSNLAAGQTGVFYLKQDATGGRTFSLPSQAKTPQGGAAIVQQTGGASVSVLSYTVLDTSTVLVNYVGDYV